MGRSLLDGAEQEFPHAFPEISTQECIQNRVDARVKVGEQEG